MKLQISKSAPTRKLLRAIRLNSPLADSGELRASASRQFCRPQPAPNRKLLQEFEVSGADGGSALDFRFGDVNAELSVADANAVRTQDLELVDAFREL